MLREEYLSLAKRTRRFMPEGFQKIDNTFEVDEVRSIDWSYNDESFDEWLEEQFELSMEKLNE